MPEPERFRVPGLPEHPDEYRTGALPLVPDPRDYLMARIPEVALMLEVGAPPTYNLDSHVKGIYSQEGPSCAAFSSMGMKSVEDEEEHSTWIKYDGTEVYRACGGNGSNGVYARDVLNYLQTKGALVLGGTARYRIGSYAFAPQVVGQFEETVKAAIAVGRPCVMAFLLPMVFGWDSAGGMSGGYHQLCVTGYDDTYVWGPNSWGPQWGRNGFYRVRWDFVTGQDFQFISPFHYAYAYTVIDALDPDIGPPPPPPPPPPPDRRVFVRGEVVGADRESMRVAAAYTFSALRASLDVTDVTYQDTQPSPTPVPNPPLGLIATAGDSQVTLRWSPSVGAQGYFVWRSTTPGGPYTLVAPVAATDNGFTNGGLANGTTYYYVVSAHNAAGESALSAEVSATPQGGTPQPSELILTVTAKRSLRSVTVIASLTDKAGAPVAGIIGSAPVLRNQPTNASGATGWVIQAVAGTVIELTATAGSLTTRASVTIP